VWRTGGIILKGKRRLNGRSIRQKGAVGLGRYRSRRSGGYGTGQLKWRAGRKRMPLLGVHKGREEEGKNNAGSDGVGPCRDDLIKAGGGGRVEGGHRNRQKTLFEREAEGSRRRSTIEGTERNGIGDK
jgi:hypothetical protein